MCVYTHSTSIISTLITQETENSSFLVGLVQKQSAVGKSLDKSTKKDNTNKHKNQMIGVTYSMI